MWMQEAKPVRKLVPSVCRDILKRLLLKTMSLGAVNLRKVWPVTCCHCGGVPCWETLLLSAFFFSAFQGISSPQSLVAQVLGFDIRHTEVLGLVLGEERDVPMAASGLWEKDT